MHGCLGAAAAACVAGAYAEHVPKSSRAAPNPHNRWAASGRASPLRPECRTAARISSVPRTACPKAHRQRQQQQQQQHTLQATQRRAQSNSPHRHSGSQTTTISLTCTQNNTLIAEKHAVNNSSVATQQSGNTEWQQKWLHGFGNTPGGISLGSVSAPSASFSPHL